MQIRGESRMGVKDEEEQGRQPLHLLGMNRLKSESDTKLRDSIHEKWKKDQWTLF